MKTSYKGHKIRKDVEGYHVQGTKLIFGTLIAATDWIDDNV